MPLSWTLDKIGPICRSAEDCGLVLHAIAGGDSNDPGSAGKSFYFAPQFARKPSEMKVGFAAADTEWADPEIRPVLDAAMKTLRETGVTLVEVKLPDYPWGAMISTVIGAEAASVFENLITSGHVNDLADPSQAEGLKASLEYPRYPIPEGDADSDADSEELSRVVRECRPSGRPFALQRRAESQRAARWYAIRSARVHLRLACIV